MKFDSKAKSKRALKEVKECLCNLSVFLAKSDSHSSVASMASHSADKGSEEFNESSSSSELSVSYDVLLESGCKIHKDTLKAIWQKASSHYTNSCSTRGKLPAFSKYTSQVHWTV